MNVDERKEQPLIRIHYNTILKGIKMKHEEANNFILPHEGFVRLPVILNILGIGKTTWWNGVREGRYPKPVKPSPNISAWHVDDIRRLIESFKVDNYEE